MGFHGPTSTIYPTEWSSIPDEPIKVLIPSNFNGPFYYPPCKCDLFDQIRYFNPKTKTFYFHGIRPVNGENKNVLIGEPEYFFKPNEKDPNFVNAFFNHHAAGHPDQSQLTQYYPNPLSSVESMGLSEAFLVSMVLILWLYSFLRLYSAWQKVLNFSESSIQGPQGWDLLVNWILERIKFKKSRLMQAMGTKKKQVSSENSVSFRQEVFQIPTFDPDRIVELEEGSLGGEMDPDRDLPRSCSVNLIHEEDVPQHKQQRIFKCQLQVKLTDTNFSRKEKKEMEIMETEIR